jgi:hypothetical protein
MERAYLDLDFFIDLSAKTRFNRFTRLNKSTRDIE